MSELRPGQRVGPYVVTDELGRGGMGVVWRVRDANSGRELALKLQRRPQNAAGGQRFEREAEIAANLKHPGIVRLHAADVWHGYRYQAYELVEGARSLTEASEGAPLNQRLAWVRDAAGALAFAHQHGVVHRDVKPDNLLVDRYGHLRVTDFGLARALHSQRLTTSGVLIGTPAYLSPEQITASKTGPSGDVWALGVVLYEVICGSLPFQADTLPALVTQICDARLPRLPGKLPAGLQAVVDCALQKDPEQRYPSASNLATDLQCVLAGEPLLHARAVSGFLSARNVVFALILIAAGVAAAFALRGPPAPAPEPRVAWVTQPHVTLERTRTLRGRVDFPSGSGTVSLAGEAAKKRTSGSFVFRVDLRPGINRVQVLGTDANGTAARATLEVTRQVPPWWDTHSLHPTLPLPAGLSWAATPGVYANDLDGSELVYLPASRFSMGRDDTRDGNMEREVTLSKGYFLGRYEVTFGQFQRYVAATGAPSLSRTIGSFMKGTRAFESTEPAQDFVPQDDHPAYNVLWEHAAAYCAWAGGRLPSEAEWEFAARGPNGSVYPWGSNSDPEPGAPPYANVSNREDGFPFTAPVGSFPQGASPWGALDLCGNVGEWCADLGGPILSPDPVIDPQGLSDGLAHVYRGGSWSHKIRRSDSMVRRLLGSEQPMPQVGFRICRDEP